MTTSERIMMQCLQTTPTYGDNVRNMLKQFMLKGFVRSGAYNTCTRIALARPSYGRAQDSHRVDTQVPRRGTNKLIGCTVFHSYDEPVAQLEEQHRGVRERRN